MPTFSSTIHQMSWLKLLSVGSGADAASDAPAWIIPASSA